MSLGLAGVLMVGCAEVTAVEPVGAKAAAKDNAAVLTTAVAVVTAKQTIQRALTGQQTSLE